MKGIASVSDLDASIIGRHGIFLPAFFDDYYQGIYQDSPQ
jgi:hypothetical protein